MKVNANITLVLACGTAIALAGAASLLVSRPAAATPQFAKDTGKACGDCHTNPAGGGALTPLGEKFKANGNKLPK
jgi:cytochrome c553